MPEACLRIGRIQSGYVDSFTGEPRLRRAVDDEPARPAEHVSRAEPLFMAPPEIPRRNGFDQNPDVADGHCDAARPAAVSHTDGFGPAAEFRRNAFRADETLVSDQET
jgi:hypothetical protein